MTPRSSAPALVLLLALAAAMLFGSRPDRWTRGDVLVTWNHMAVAENLSPEHRFLGFYRQWLDDEGRRRYAERLETPPADAFGAMPASFRRRRRTALERAEHLRRALSAVARPVDSDGRAMFAWLSQTLQRLPATA